MTAEPHFLVESPSREVVAASLPPDEKEGYETEPIEVHFRGDIGLESVPWQEDRVSTQRDRETPVELFEARRAIDIARYFQVDLYASKEFKQADAWLADAEMAFEKGVEERAAIWARRVVVMVEVARRLARERRDAEEQRRKETIIADLEDRATQAEKDLGNAKTDIVQLNRTLDQKVLELRETQDRATGLANELEQATVAIQQRDDQIRQLTESERRLREQLDASPEQAKWQALEIEINRLRQTSIPLTEHRGKLELARISETRDDGDQFVVVLPNDQLFAATRRPASGIPQLKPEGTTKLDRIADILATYPMGEYSIEGHVAGSGSAERLQSLSQANAAAVVAYLLTRGVPSENLKAVGRGADAPLATGKTAQAQRKNQRIEIVIRRS
jgi:outer membrane protein OmpA-like peptidoglycan-associated protein